MLFSVDIGTRVVITEGYYKGKTGTVTEFSYLLRFANISLDDGGVMAAFLSIIDPLTALDEIVGAVYGKGQETTQ